jgi:hypothetical protein
VKKNTSEDTCSALRSDTVPFAVLPALQNSWWAAPIAMQPGSLIGVSGVMTPFVSAAMAVIGLKVEPVG